MTRGRARLEVNSLDLRSNILPRSQMSAPGVIVATRSGSEVLTLFDSRACSRQRQGPWQGTRTAARLKVHATAELCTAIHETVHHAPTMRACTTPLAPRMVRRGHKHTPRLHRSPTLHGALLGSALRQADAAPRQLPARSRAPAASLARSAAAHAAASPHCTARCPAPADLHLRRRRSLPAHCQKKERGSARDAQSTQAWHTQRRVPAMARRVGC